MTSKEYLAALLPKMQGMDVAHRAMMGGYLIYYNSKYIISNMYILFCRRRCSHQLIKMSGSLLLL